MGWGVHDYPSPPEKEEQNVKGTIRISYTFETEVPKKWSKEDILNDIEENINEYISISTYTTIEEIDI